MPTPPVTVSAPEPDVVELALDVTAIPDELSTNVDGLYEIWALDDNATPEPVFAGEKTNLCAELLVALDK